MEQNDNLEIQKKKILIMGLENSGKTSIILNLLKKDNLTDYISVNPTRELNINTLKRGNSAFSLWELGGQKSFIQKYLENFEDYINDTEELFFVIDIQDFSKYDSALDYLEKVIIELGKMVNAVEITVFLHKFDHDIYDKNPQINETLIDNLIAKIKSLIPSNHYFEIYKTTIYTVLDKAHIF